MDGTVLVSFIVPGDIHLFWHPDPYHGDIWGPCVGRVRALPDGPWIVLAYFPEGYPGPTAAFPEGKEIGQTAKEIGT